jgi:ferredoxin-NADP reductase/uncharacterized protein YcbX
MGKVSTIMHYPVKGWPGLVMQQTDLRSGYGLPFDRFLAVSNGSRDVPAQAWTACQAFVRMTKNPQLPLFKINFDGATEQLKLSFNGEELILDCDNAQSLEAAAHKLVQWFPEHASQHIRLHRRNSDLGWWDHPDAEISLINEATVASLQMHADVALDSSRFRGNLLLSGLRPWEELEWLGRTVQIGDAQLRILRPIDRCKATSLNPETAQADVNLPALLARHVGHLYCGVYAQVVKAGRVAPGDMVKMWGTAPQVTTQALPDTAPAAQNWPRSAEVVRREDEDSQVTSFWLHDEVFAQGVRPEPGQHIRLHMQSPTHGHTWRAYTISKVEGPLLRISIKRDTDMGVAAHLHQSLQEGQRITVSGPFGAFTLPRIRGDQPAHAPLILLSAGIGITPMVAMLQSMLHIGWQAPVHMIHTARHSGQLALWAEAEQCLAQLQTQSLQGCDAFSSLLHRSQVAGLPSRRLDWAQLTHLPWAQASVAICGPDSFMRDARLAAQYAGTPAQHIHHERFFSPQIIAAAEKSMPTSGPWQISINTKHGTQSFNWHAQDSSILDCAEAQGLELPANCRAGACGACVLRLKRGEVQYAQEPLVPLAANEILSCCAHACSDLVLEI